MKNRLTHLLLLLIGVGIGFVAARMLPHEETTLSRLSPNDRYRVRLIEPPRLPFYIDRNFELRIEDLETGSIRTIFRSPDEGRPEGSEQVIWSLDSSRFILIGRHYSMVHEDQLPGGLQLYLLYDIESGRLWCNSRQQSAHPPFSLDDLLATPWEIPLPGTDTGNPPDRSP